MFRKIKRRVKKIFGFKFFPKLQQDERGLVLIGWLILAGIAALGGLLVYENWPAILKGLIGSIMLLLISISTSLAKFSGAFFNSVAGSSLLSRPITQDPMVLHGWTIVRNFANMFVVLGFVVVGLATILRIREYEAQKTLLPLIIVALLINFSLLFCGIIIDATNITMNYFTQISGPAGITQPFLDVVTNPQVVNNIRDAAQKEETNSAFINHSLSFSLLAFIVAMIFFIYGILFLFRYVALMCLVILAPLGFVCYVFPATHGIYKKWWEQFTQWAIIGIPAAFFVYLAGHLIQNSGLSSGNVGTTGADLAYWIPVGFLLFAYSLIFQTSAIGASAAIGLATGAMGYAWGATKWTGGKALRGAGAITGASRLGSAAKSKVVGWAEKMRLVAPGTSTRPEREAVDKYKKDFTRLNNQQISDNLDKKAVWTRPGVRQRAALAELAIDRGAFDPNKARHVAGLKDAQARGFTITPEHAEKDPRLERFNASTMDNLTRPVAKGGKGLSQADAEIEATRQAVQGMSPRVQKNIRPKALEDLNVFEHLDFTDPQTMNEFKKASQSRINSLKKWHTDDPNDPGNPDHPFQKINARIAELNATGNPVDAAKATKLTNNQIELATHLP